MTGSKDQAIAVDVQAGQQKMILDGLSIIRNHIELINSQIGRSFDLNNRIEKRLVALEYDLELMLEKVVDDVLANLEQRIVLRLEKLEKQLDDNVE